MRLACCFALAASVLFGACAWGAGYASDENFIVLAAERQTADMVLAAAAEFADEAARKWLGKTEFVAERRTWITVELTVDEDQGLFWPIDDPRRKLHKLWIATSPERAVGSTLRHEMTHVVFATQLSTRLPAWANEGAASRCDEHDRAARRNEIMRACVDQRRWPSLESLFATPRISIDDETSYATAASVTEHLIARSDERSFIEFALAGERLGWDAALMQYYNIPSLDVLQTQWQAWTAQRVRRPVVAPTMGRPVNVFGSATPLRATGS